MNDDKREQFESMKRLLSRIQHLTKGSRRVYLMYIEKICLFTNMNPDKLVASVKDAAEPLAQVKIIDNRFTAFLHDELRYHATTLHNAVTPLFELLRANDVTITRKDIEGIHSGSSSGLMKFRKGDRLCHNGVSAEARSCDWFDHSANICLLDGEECEWNDKLKSNSSTD